MDNKTKILLVTILIVTISVATYSVYFELTKPTFRLYNTFWSDNVNLYIYEVQYNPSIFAPQSIGHLEVLLDAPASLNPLDNTTEGEFKGVRPDSIFALKSPIKEITVRFKWESREEEYTFEIES